MQLVVTRLVALKSLLFLSGSGAVQSFPLQLPTLPKVRHDPSVGSTVVGWNLRKTTSLSSSSAAAADVTQPIPFATPAQVRQLLAEHPNAILLDARTEEEIAQHGHLHIPGHPWVHTSCTPMECPLLSSAAGDSLLPDKQVPVIVYCASGKRAAKAKEVLEGKGYHKVLNAGAFGDLHYLKAL